MTVDQFHNAIRLLYSIDSDELGDPSWWPQFRENPPDFFIRCDDERAEKIWGVMERQMK